MILSDSLYLEKVPIITDKTFLIPKDLSLSMLNAPNKSPKYNLSVISSISL